MQDGNDWTLTVVKRLGLKVFEGGFGGKAVAALLGAAAFPGLVREHGLVVVAGKRGAA